jgi:hypothetical protein
LIVYSNISPAGNPNICFNCQKKTLSAPIFIPELKILSFCQFNLGSKKCFLITNQDETMGKNNPDNSNNLMKLSGGTDGGPVSMRSRFTGMEIPLSDWNRSLCAGNEYPAFGDPEPVILPDALTEQMFEFEGFACYETTFVLDNQKEVFLEISDSSGCVDIFINGEIAGTRIEPPCRYDLSSLARQGKNYLAIEVGINPESNKKKSAKGTRDNINRNDPIPKADIIGTVRIYAG